MTSSLHNRFTIVLLFIIATLSPLAAEDASVDQLIKKLPPPEKVAQSAIAIDPALRDPLAKQVVEATKAMNFGTAYALSQKLASRYPKSAAARCLQGGLALRMHKYKEAAAAYHQALVYQPNFAVAYLGLGASELAQNNFNAAMSDYRQVVRLAPKSEIGYVALSVCDEKMGRRSESLNYAHQATTVAPSSALAWYLLSREENLSGNKSAAQKDLAHANDLRRRESKTTKH